MREQHKQTRSHSQRVCAYDRRWPDPDFIKEVEEAFPDKGVANVEEARVSLCCSWLQQLYEGSWACFGIRKPLLTIRIV